MSTLYHEINVMTSPNRAWQLLTTKAGISLWWPGEISIQGGDSWRLFRKEQESALVVRVVEEEPERLLEWLCTQGEDDWHNTLIHWRIEPQEAGLRLILEHKDLRKTPQQLAQLNTLWGIWMNAIGECLHQDIDTLDSDDLNAWT